VRKDAGNQMQTYFRETRLSTIFRRFPFESPNKPKFQSNIKPLSNTQNPMKTA
jgi:hypothetical protein